MSVPLAEALHTNLQQTHPDPTRDTFSNAWNSDPFCFNRLRRRHT
ncbi:hypothetical protein ABIE00_002538 [Arthrobacter sp. OAP107]